MLPWRQRNNQNARAISNSWIEIQTHPTRGDQAAASTQFFGETERYRPRFSLNGEMESVEDTVNEYVKLFYWFYV